MGDSLRRRVSLILIPFITACSHDSSSVPSSAASAYPNVGLAIMPLGDSITYGAGDDEGPDHGGYRVPLYNELRFSFHFVGSQINGPPSLLDHRHEGHPGYTIDQIRANIDTWLAWSPADIVLLHIGTNDFAQNLDVANAPARLRLLIQQILSDAPTAKVFVAQIVPFSPGTTRDQEVMTYNQGVASVVAELESQGAAVYLVDMHSDFTTADLSQDREHPVSAGYAKMASHWANAINLAINGTASL